MRTWAPLVPDRGHPALPAANAPRGWQGTAVAVAVALVVIGTGIISAGSAIVASVPTQMAAGHPGHAPGRGAAVRRTSAPMRRTRYLPDGMTEELITQLSKIGRLRVIARTSSMKYKGTKEGVAEIGRALQVATILEGSVRKAGNQAADHRPADQRGEPSASLVRGL